MAQIRLHFYESLNDFVEPALRDIEIIHHFDRKASVKDVIESFNIPHTEIEQILVNNNAVGFNYIVQQGDHIQVYPVSRNAVMSSATILRPELPRPPLFVVDVNLGKLARYLRLLGFDCLYCNSYTDDTVAKIADEQWRIVLTRDCNLLQRRIITYGYFVRASLPKIQIKEVLNRFDLYPMLKTLNRCSHCNGQLIETEKQNVEHRLEPLTKQHFHRFLICSECDQIYWHGSHCTRVQRLIEDFSRRGL